MISSSTDLPAPVPRLNTRRPRLVVEVFEGDSMPVGHVHGVHVHMVAHAGGVRSLMVLTEHRRFRPSPHRDLCQVGAPA